jgi:hypothetical protein
VTHPAGEQQVTVPGQVIHECGRLAMDRSDIRIHSFIIRFWLEDPSGPGEGAGWHGQITHVPGGEQRYLLGLSDIVPFILPYLGVTPRRLCLRRWVRRWLDRGRSDRDRG